METGNLLQPWREQLISPRFLPSKLCKLTHGGVGSQKLCSLFPICFWRAKQRVSGSCAQAKPFGSTWLDWRFTAPCFLSLVPCILGKVFPVFAYHVGAGTYVWGWFQTIPGAPFSPVTRCGLGTPLPPGLQSRSQGCSCCMGLARDSDTIVLVCWLRIFISQGFS